MLTGIQEIIILRGSAYNATWWWKDTETGIPDDFAGLTATIKIKNIDDEFADVQNTFIVGTAIVEPQDINGNTFKGRIDISLSRTDTLKFAIPTHEEDRYGDSGIYGILSITLSNGVVVLQAKIRVLESLESETYQYLADNANEILERIAIIENKLTAHGI